jgi:glycosyltransferase involved in cell wall biosynthesis
MKILFFSHYFYPEGNAPASRVHALTKHWVEQGHEVTVVTCVPNVPDGVVYEGYKNRLYQKEVINGVNVIRIWTFLAPNKGTVRRIANYISYMSSAILSTLFIKRHDVMIATSPQFFCGWAGVLLKYLSLKRIPFVLEIRDIWPESIVAVGSGMPAPVIKILECMEKLMYRAADKIVTVGVGYQQRLIEKGVPEDKISIIMNGVDSDIFHPQDASSELLDKWGLRDKFVCSYIGTVGMACGLNVVLDTAAKLKENNRNDIVFMIVGDGASRNDLENEARARNLDNVIFTGRQPKDMVPAFLASSDACLVHLKKTDLFTTVMPSKIFEAAGMARPIIIGVKGPATEIVLQASAGLEIEPEDVDSLLETVNKMADSPDLCKTLGLSGFNNIASKFDRKELSEKYLKLIDRWFVNH